MNRSHKQSLTTLLVLIICTLPFLASAQTRLGSDSLAITLTPPLFQVTQTPGSEWRSIVRLVNSNTYDISVNVDVQDFHPDGETGNPVFENVARGDPKDPHRMSGWIEVPSRSIIIKHSTTGEIPFIIHVPLNADPGGHYAAILVGTTPSSVEGSGSGVSSAIGSLVFMRVPGEVVEKGSIRDFYAVNNITQTTDQSFVMRFENEGNVHLVPQGNIVITNMWGKERGKVDINQTSTFGNVLPGSTRKFEFTWHGESNPFEVGRYKAEATLVYGTNAKVTVYRTIYFWIVPWKPVVSILGGLFFFFWFISWAVRRYIRKALELERQWLAASGASALGRSSSQASQKTMQEERPSQVARPQGAARSGTSHEVSFETLRRPLTLRGIDLREARTARSETVIHEKTAVKAMDKGATPANTVKRSQIRENSETSLLAKWLRHNRSFMLFMFVLLAGFSVIGWYFVEVFQNERAYQIEQIRPK